MVAPVVLAHGLQQAERPHQVRLHERRGVEQGIVVVRLGREVDDDVVLRHQLLDELCDEADVIGTCRRR